MPKLKLSQTTIDSLKADLGSHPSVTSAGTSFNWAGLITIIENIVNEILPLFTGTAPVAPTPTATVPKA